MTITIYNTDKVVILNGIASRVWEGETSTGIKVHCYITRIAHDIDEPRKDEFIDELTQVSAPSAEVEAIPMRLIL